MISMASVNQGPYCFTQISITIPFDDPGLCLSYDMNKNKSEILEDN